MLCAHLSYRRPLAPRGQELGVNPAQDLMGYTQMRSSRTGPSHCADPADSGSLSRAVALRRVLGSCMSSLRSCIGGRAARSLLALLRQDLAAGAGASALRVLLLLDCEVLPASSIPTMRILI